MDDSVIEDGSEGVNTPEYSVSEISGAVKRSIEAGFGHVRVRGEVGRVSRPRSGHVYLDLKDDRAVLAGVIWKGSVRTLELSPEEGDEVIATGRLTTFPGQSRYQIVIEQMAYAGTGALLAKLERLRAALAAEGLFEPSRKRALPFLPRVIGVVTSPSGAVIRDILHRLAERFPVQVLVWPVAVQGQGCAPQVAAAIRGFNALAPDGPIPRPDVLIVARGGGSVEDLWGFNDEAVVRAAAGSAIPLISAVGHETDTTLIDHAADRRAPTPTAAAEIAVPVRADLAAALSDLDGRRLRALARSFERRGQRLRDIARALPRPQDLVTARAQRLDAAAARLPRPRLLVETRTERLKGLAARLPLALAQRVWTARSGLATPAARLDPRLLSGRVASLGDRLADRRRRLDPALRAAFGVARRDLGAAAARLGPRLVRLGTARLAERLADRARRLDPAIATGLRGRRERATALARLLDTLGYPQTLARGFAVVRDEGGRVLTDATALATGQVVALEFRDSDRHGQPRATVASGGSDGPPTPQGRTRTPGKAAPRAARPTGQAPAAAQPSLFDES